MSILLVEIVCDVLVGVCVGGMLIPLIVHKAFSRPADPPDAWEMELKDRAVVDASRLRYEWPAPMADDLLGTKR